MSAAAAPRAPLRTVVLLAYYYPPLGGVGSQRALGFARHLPEFGFRPVVVAPRRGAYGLDPTLPTGEGDGVVVVRTGTLEPAVLARRLGPRRRGGDPAGDMVEGAGTGGLASLARRALRSTVYFPDHARGWTGAATRAARRAGRRHGAVAVVSTSPPVSAHVAALRAARALGVPAVLDFRDLWTAHREGGEGDSRGKAERRLEESLLAEAAAVTTVSDGCRRWLAGRHVGGAPKPFVVLRNGYEPADFAGPAPAREPAAFRLVHAGTVYGERQDTTALFRALARLRADGAFGPLRPEVVLAGKVDPHALDAARAAGCEDLLVRRGFVTHQEAVRLQRAATANLLLTWSVPGPVADGVCPGKMYEELAAGRPILALALPGCEAASVLEESGGALVADPRDEAAIVGAVARLASAAREGDALAAVPPRRAPLDRFSRRTVAGELAALLASLVS